MISKLRDMVMTRKYQSTAAPGVSLFSFFKAFPVSTKSGIQTLTNCQVPGCSLKKFDYG